ncbi:MAG: hypothetical protein H7210_05590 [Pyrinomonadaceae bacterium]|nr:hypothetical protein [Phycisphaerales bacterium]
MQIVDAAGDVTEIPVAGQNYTLRIHIINHGAAASYGGIVEFLVAEPALIDAAAINPSTVLPRLGYTGFVANPGSAITVTCPKVWTPTSDAEASRSVLALVYDPFVDPVTRRYDARNDRHVARRDLLPGFGGIWEGIESANSIHPAQTMLRIVIVQDRLAINADFYSQVGSTIPSTPQVSGTGAIGPGRTISLRRMHWNSTMAPVKGERWVLSLTSPTVLHVEHYMHEFRGYNPIRAAHTVFELSKV